MSEHPLVRLARKTIETYVNEGKVIPLPEELSPEMRGPAGVFVSLHRRHQLRGCIGTFQPTTRNVAEEIIRNAIESATRDPRFSPLKKDELADLEISVDVLSPPERVDSIAELDAKKFGVIVAAGGMRGLLLPDLEGVNTPEEQIAICRRKAGIGENEPVELFRFNVRRYH
jgi:AmmeMemoRadiSam system protein A